MKEKQKTRLKRKAKVKERAYVVSLMRTSSENYMPRSVGKLHKKLNSQKKHLIQKEPSMSDDFLLQCQILLKQ